jgi:hypothetical protein
LRKPFASRIGGYILRSADGNEASQNAKQNRATLRRGRIKLHRNIGDAFAGSNNPDRVAVTSSASFGVKG